MTQADIDRNEIIEMARQAGWTGIFSQWISPTERQHLTVPVTIEQIEAFAKLVASAASAKEREACAKVCEYESGDGPDNGCCPTYWNEAQEACAKAIRARGQQ